MNFDNLTEQELDEMLLLMEEEAHHRDSMNAIYGSIWRFKGRYVILIGGSGSGKSYAIADRVIDRTLEHDKSRLLCCRKQQKQVTESQFPLLWSRTPSSGFGKKESPGHESIYSASKGEILFAGLDNVEKLKSIFDITSVWVEEADSATAEDVRELDRRLRGYDGLMQLYLSFNPVSNLNFINKMFFSERIKEYTIKENGKRVTKQLDRTAVMRGVIEFDDFPYWEDIDYDFDRKVEVWDDETGKWEEEYFYNTLIIHSTYRDNKFIDKQYRQIMNKLKEDDPEEYDIYGMGQWGVPGGTYFDKKSINLRIKANVKPIAMGDFEYVYKDHQIDDSTIRWVESDNGAIKIYAYPEEHVPYVLGGDTAGEGSDWNTAFVIDNTTGEDVATLRLNHDEDLYARQVYCLGKWYGTLSNCFNNALVGLEINHSTHPNKEIIRMGYDNIYIREQEPDAISEELVARYGWRTTGTQGGGGTRPLMLGILRAIVREEPYLLKDMDFLREATTFVKNEKGKPVAASGYHDDMIIARAITCAIAEQQPNYKRIIRDNTITEDIDDYLMELTSW